MSSGPAVGICLEFKHLGLEDHHVQQFVNSSSLFCGNINEYGISAPVFRDKSYLSEFALHPVRFGPGLVYLVYGYDYGHTRGLGVVDCLSCLGHDTVICRNHKDYNVGNAGAPGPHGGKCLVTWRIQEDNVVSGCQLHAVGSDMLGNAACLACSNVRPADGIQE